MIDLTSLVAGGVTVGFGLVVGVDLVAMVIRRLLGLFK